MKGTLHVNFTKWSRGREACLCAALHVVIEELNLVFAAEFQLCIGIQITSVWKTQLQCFI